jgi:hypothetical protein
MARWAPAADQPIGNTERIGRRLFDEPLLAGAGDQKTFAGLDLRNFEETRSREVSLDRLGRSGIDKAVIRYLQPRAVAAGTKFRTAKQFAGWAFLPARDLSQSRSGFGATSLVPSPIEGQDLEENVYHAHVLKPEGMHHYIMALHLRHLFATYGQICPVETRSSRLAKMQSWWRNLFKSGAQH